MSNDKKNEFHGELLPAEVIRKGIYELGKVERVPPEVGIFDSPTRCFVVNVEWWSHIAGMVHLLADVVSWRDADDESYFAIKEILRFMQGIECMDFQLRQNPDDSCLLEQTLDGGETWTTAFNYALCLTAQLSSINQYLTAAYQQSLVDNGFVPETSTPSDYYTPEELQDFGIQAEVCDTDGKDAVYGAVNQLVRYIHGVNVDFLQELSQAANVPQQVERFVAAVPGVGLLPFDELLGYTAFIVDELLAEYNATADETLLQTVVCDLFCIAVNSGCHLDFNDVYNYFAGKVSPSFSNVSTTLLNLTQFAITGTFAGDDYFYFMCYFQLIVAGMKQKFLGVQGVETYAMQVAAGYNSPDNDWSIFCIDCPELYRMKIWDFTTSSEDAIITTGFDLVRGVHVPGNGWGLTAAGAPGDGLFTVGLQLNPEWKILAIAAKFANKSAGDGNLTDTQFRPTSGTAVGMSGVDWSWGTTGWTYYRNEYVSIDGWAELALRYADQLADDVYLSHIGIVFDPDYAPIDAVITDNRDFSGTVFP